MEDLDTLSCFWDYVPCNEVGSKIHNIAHGGTTWVFTTIPINIRIGNSNGGGDVKSKEQAQIWSSLQVTEKCAWQHEGGSAESMHKLENYMDYIKLNARLSWDWSSDRIT